MTRKQLDERQLAQVVGGVGECGNPRHGHTDRLHICGSPDVIQRDPPGGREDWDVAGGTGDGANQEFGG